MHTRFEFKPPRYSSVAAHSRFACTELLSGPGLPTDQAHARFELELPSYCSASAKSRFACNELLSGPELPPERVHARFGLKLHRHCSAATISRFFCTELLGLLLVFSTLGCSESLWVVEYDVSDILTSLDSVVATSNRTGACPIRFDTDLLLFCCCEELL